jgi:hypothetical protein
MKNFPENNEITIKVPERFLEFCGEEMVNPLEVLCGFIGDLIGYDYNKNEPEFATFNTNGSDERDLANRYFYRCGYTYCYRSKREMFLEELYPICLKAMKKELRLPEEERQYLDDDIDFLVSNTFEKNYPGFSKYSDKDGIVDEVVEKLKRERL